MPRKRLRFGLSPRRSNRPSNSQPHHCGDSIPRNKPRPPVRRKLAGSKNDWRIRVGDCRVDYEIADQISVVRVNRVRHRSEVYR